MKYNDKTIEKSVILVLEQTLGFNLLTSTFIPIGEESYAFLAVLKDGNKYFVKYCDKQNIIKSIDNVNTLLLEMRRFDFIVPPIEINGNTSFKVGKGKIYIYPYIEGSIVRMDNEKFDKVLVDALTQIMVSIHSSKSKILDVLPEEKFENNYSQRLSKILANKSKLDTKATIFLEDNENIVSDIIEKQNQVANIYKQKRSTFVLTHGDITGLNIIITNNRDIKLVDWDGAILAPRERDLIFLYENPNFSLKEYIRLSSGKPIDLRMKEYYERQWALNSIIENFERLSNNSSSKEDTNECLEEIQMYLDYYK